MKKRLVAFLLVLIMVLGMLPVSAFAADDGVSPQALDTGHKIDVTFTVLYVGDEFRIGYNTGASEKTQFVCQYSTPHSDTAYTNHTIAISDIKAAADRASVNSGYQIVGWSKEANENPTVWPLNKSGDTACNKGTTIYLVAKNPNPNPTYMYYLYYKYNDGTNSTWLTEVPDRPTTATTFTFHVNTAKLKDRRGYDHIGWADKADAVTAKYKGGEAIVLTKDDPTKTIYAVWMPFFELKYDANGGTGAPASQTRTAAHPTVNRVTFTVPNQTPSKEGYTFKGWADSATATTVQYQPGGTVDVKHENSPKTVYAVWEGSDPIPAPSYDDLKSAIGKIQVKDVSTPSCGTENYDLIDNTQSEPFNWTKTARLDQPGKYDVTIKTAPYVAKYNSEKSKTHELNNANQTTLKLVISYENNTWKLDDGLRVIEVKHSEQTPPTDKPAKPTENDVTGVVVDIVCVTTTGTHDTVQYPLGFPTDAQHTIGEVVSDGAGGYICPVTVRTAWFVQQASNLVWKVQHTPTAQTITFNLTYDKTNKKWVKPAANPRIEATHEVTPDKPGDQKPNIEKANAKIRVQCIEYPSKHNPYKQNYRILSGSYEDLGWDQTEYGYIYSIRLNRAKYIAQFDQEIGRPHTDTEPNEETRINWRWKNGAWHLIGGPDGIDADIKVKCDQTETPPTKPIITGRQEYIRVICKNEPNKERNYVPKFGRYTESDPAVQKVNGIWTYTITILRDKHVEEFNKDFPGHEDTDPNAVTTMSWVWKDAEWKLVPVNGLRTVGAIIEVTCKPKAPTADELKKLDMAVQVKCVVDAAQQHTDAYGLLGEYDEDYFVGEPRKDGDDWLCDISYDPNLYVAEFNKTFPNPKHVQNDEQIVPVTLIWAGDSWQLKTQGRVHVTEEYTVTFNAYGGFPTPDEQHVKSGEKAVLPVEPMLKGYIFAFWYLGEDEQNATAYDFNTPVTENITLTAKWNINKYTVTFNSYGGTPVPPVQEVEYGLTATKPADPTLKGYTFAFWYLGEDEQNATAYDFDTPVTENITLTAKWNINKYTVAFNTDGGTPVPPAQEVEYGLTATEPAAPEKTGYTFDGWYLGDEKYDFSAAVEQNITLTAKWTQNTYTVTFDPNGGNELAEADKTKVVKIGEAYGELPTPTRKGYNFAGWYTAAEEGTVVTADTTVTATTDHTLYAHWTLIPPAAGSKPSYSGVNVRVNCVDNKSEHKQGAYFYGLVYGLSDYSGINEPESWVEEDGEYFYTLTINKDVYIARYANTTKTAHTEVGENKTEVKWQWNGTKWVLLNEKDDKGIVLTINVKCEEKQTVQVVIYRNGNTEKAYQTVALEKMPKGTVIDLTKLNIADYYTANYTGRYDFYGWFNDGSWNEYKKNPERAGLDSITVNGWTNIIAMVYDYEKITVSSTLKTDAIYSDTVLRGTNVVDYLNGLDLDLEVPGYEVETDKDGNVNWYKKDSPKYTFGANDTVSGWTNVLVKYNVAPHNIYAYLRTGNSIGDVLELNEATLNRLGLTKYNTEGFISIGTFVSNTLLTQDEYYGFDEDEAFLDVLAELQTKLVPETGVSLDKVGNKINWSWLYQPSDVDDRIAGYPTEDTDGYQLSGSLLLYGAKFEAGANDVTGMPTAAYGAYLDYFVSGESFNLPAAPTRPGYDFKGWKIGNAVLTAGAAYTVDEDDMVFTAQWEARTDTPYTVEHYLENLDGSYALDTTEPLKGTTDTTVTAAAKSYDNFTYDSTVPGTVASGNIAGDGSLVLKLFYTRNTYDYTVRHIKQLPDGSYDEANAEVETLSGKFEALAAVTAKDYGEHYPTNDADTKQNIKIEKGLTIDVKYDLDEHTLTFETNGGSAINPVTVRHGNAVARPADPTKDKYTFIGWYADPEFTEEYDFATVLEADKTIYAKFELTSTPIGDIYVRYDVLHIKQLPDGTYDLANAEVEHLSAKKDTTVTAVIKDYRATHHVNVNRTLSKLTGTAIQPYMGVDGKPVYTILSVYYDLDFHTLTFDTMGGSKIAPETVRHGLTVAKPKDPVNGGYWFDGWYTDKTYRTPYNFATPLTQDTTIYAKWFLIVLPGVTDKKATPKLNTSDHFAYVQGYPNGTVKPAGNITRAETAAILFRLMDEGSRKTYYSTKSGFRDVASGSWYNTYVATLNNAGVITDSSNGYFRPNEAITRAELAAMLAKFSETTGAANYFNDVSAKYWAANAIAICAKLGWITGYPDGTFRPDKNVTRAELMAMINRATGRAPKSADAFLPGMKTWIDNTSDKWYYLDVQEATNSHSYTVKGSETWTALTSDPNWSLYE